MSFSIEGEIGNGGIFRPDGASVEIPVIKVGPLEIGVELSYRSGEFGADGYLKICGQDITVLADIAYDSVASSAAGELFGTRAEYMEAVLNGETNDSHLEWLRKRREGVDSQTNSDFNAARNFVQQRRDPLALDLDGDGIETAGTNNGITFDFNGDGLETGTGWVKGDDGFLALDLNGNGIIDTGAELFGVDTVKANGQKAANGFDALSDLDSNADGVFDSQDAQFANVRVWQDRNQDGNSQANELKSLAELDIIAINLGATATNQNSNGNLISATGTFIRSDGTEGGATTIRAWPLTLIWLAIPSIANLPTQLLSTSRPSRCLTCRALVPCVTCVRPACSAIR